MKNQNRLRQISANEIDGRGRKVRKQVELRSDEGCNWLMQPVSLLAFRRHKALLSIATTTLPIFQDLLTVGQKLVRSGQTTSRPLAQNLELVNYSPRRVHAVIATHRA